MRVFVLMVMTMLLFSPSKTAIASSQDACAIWICLPGGFPSGAEGHIANLKNVLRRGEIHCLNYHHAPQAQMVRKLMDIISWAMSVLSLVMMVMY